MPATGPEPTGVRRLRLDDLGDPVWLLRRLPDVRRLAVLLGGGWSHGDALMTWDPLVEADDPFGCEAGALPDPDAFGGGWVGVWGYGLGADLERLPPPPPRPVPQPRHRIGYYDRVLRHVDGQWWCEQLTGLTPDDDARRDALLASLDRLVEPRSHRTGSFTMRPDADGHVAAVRGALEEIAAGEIFQANVTARLEAAFDGDPRALFCTAIERVRPAFGAYVEDEHGAVVSLSPELFLRRDGRYVLTSPIKGTAPLDADPAALAASAKDRAENVMIVDLMRNDLGRVAEPGSVGVTALNRVERHAVWHLVSDVEARLPDDVGDGDLLRATFPPGSVTGAPKIRAMELLSGLETTAREAYTGAIGCISPCSGLELNVAIRTFEVAGGRVWLGVGGGIVADSDPVAELAECFTKAEPLVAAIGSTIATPRPPRRSEPSSEDLPETPTDRDVYDTLLVRERRPVDLDAHLARLDASTHALHHAPLGTGLAAEVERAAAELDGPHRLRVDARGDGTTAITTSPTGAPPAAATLGVLDVPGGLGPHKWADRHRLDASLPLHRDQLVVDGEDVLEAGRSAVLLVLDDEVCAPALDGRQLPSTGRERVRRLLGALGAPLVERRVRLADLQRASEVMLVNAVRGVVPVHGVDGVGTWPTGPVTGWLREALTSPPAELRRLRPEARPPSGARVLVVDSYDSFVYNLVQHLRSLGAGTDVVRDDALDLADVERAVTAGDVTHVVLSPGPGTPGGAGLAVELVRRLAGRVPVLGVCLGHQVIAEAHGARVVRAALPMHGKPCLVEHDGRGLLTDLPRPLVVGRYHSLVVDETTLPPELVVTARSPGGTVMGLRHRDQPVEGVQWHPESVLTPVGHAVLDRFLSTR